MVNCEILIFQFTSCPIVLAKKKNETKNKEGNYSSTSFHFHAKQINK